MTMATFLSGPDDPEGAIAAPIGSLYTRTDKSSMTLVYYKESGGTGATGWIAVGQDIDTHSEIIDGKLYRINTNAWRRAHKHARRRHRHIHATPLLELGSLLWRLHGIRTNVFEQLTTRLSFLDRKRSLSLMPGAGITSWLSRWFQRLNKSIRIV